MLAEPIVAIVYVFKVFCFLDVRSCLIIMIIIIIKLTCWMAITADLLSISYIGAQTRERVSVEAPLVYPVGEVTLVPCILVIPILITIIINRNTRDRYL